MSVTPNNKHNHSINLYTQNKNLNSESPEKLKKLVEKSQALVTQKIRSLSPFVEGKRNPNFVHPNFQSHFSIGNPDYKEPNDREQKFPPDSLKNLEDVVIEKHGDLRAFHEELNNKRRQIISAKINQRVKLSEIASKLLTKGNKNDKELLIDANLQKDAFIHKENKNYLLEKARERNKSNELFILKNKNLYESHNSEKDKYFSNYIDNYQPPKEYKFVNRRIEPIQNYVRAVEEQILDKRRRIDLEKSKENKIINEINENTLQELEREEILRKKQIQNQKFDFAVENRILINKKKQIQLAEKQKQLEDEIQAISKIKKEKAMILVGEKEKREKEKEELKQALQNHLQSKKEKELIEYRKLKKLALMSGQKD